MTQIKKASQVSLFAFAMVVSLAALATFMPTLMGYEARTVVSGSMGKAAPKGSVVLTRMVDGRAIATGDVVTFRKPNDPQPITHRVLSVQPVDGGMLLTTQGDANQASDPEPVMVRGSIARVEQVIPLVGYAAAGLKTPAGLGILVLVASLGLFFDRPTSRVAARKEEKVPLVAA